MMQQRVLRGHVQDRKMVEDVVSFTQQSSGSRYDPQSGQIFGVLKQMKDRYTR